MSDDHTPTDQTDEDEQIPRIETTDGKSRPFKRVWVTNKTGYACGIKEGSKKIQRYPPHRVKVVVEGI